MEQSLENLTCSQLVLKTLAFYGTQRFITAFARACHLFLSWAWSIQSMPHRHTSWRTISIVSSHLCLGLPGGLFPLDLPTKTLYASLLSPISATCPTCHILLDLITQTIRGDEYRSLSFSVCNFPQCTVTSSLLGPNILNTLFSNNSAYVPLSLWDTKLIHTFFHNITHPLNTYTNWRWISTGVRPCTYINQITLHMVTCYCLSSRPAIFHAIVCWYDMLVVPFVYV